jgi:nucleoside-diphosphate-sugar epimerase
VKAFVTGATGFLGRRLVAALLARGDEVRCLARPSSDLNPLLALRDTPGKLCIVRGDVHCPDEFARQINGCEVIYHAAATMRGATPVLFRGNVVATSDLIHAAAGRGVRRFVAISSLAVYLGAGDGRDVLDESSPLDPAPHLNYPYAYSKIAQERVTQQAAADAGMELAILRPGVIYGPGRDCLSTRVGIRLGRWLVMMGGDQTLPYTFVDNCADAVALAGATDGIGGEAFNIIDDHPPTARQLLRAYRQRVEKLPAVRVPRPAIMPLSRLCLWYHRHSEGQLPAVLTPYKSRAMWTPTQFNNAKAKQRLAWQPRVAFDEGLARTFASLAAGIPGNN